MSYFRDLSWACHVCGEERPDRYISVFSRKRSTYVTENIRFCNDRKECTAGAQTKTFLSDLDDLDT